MTASELQIKRDKLVAKIADAVASVASGDKQVSFASIEQMQKALAILDGEIAKASGGTSVRSTLATFTKG